jgi:ATP-binding cassette, subfamily C, bacterial
MMGITKLIRYFIMAYPIRSVVMVVCFLFSGLAEGISILTFLPVIELVSSGKVVENSSAGRFIGTLLDFAGLAPSLSVMLGLIVAGITAKSALLMLAMKQAGYTIAHVTSDLRLKQLKALLAAKWDYFVSQPTGHLANAISTEALRASTAYHHAILLISTIIQVGVYSVVALWVSWRLTLGSLVIALLILFILKGFIKISREAGGRQTELMKALVGRLTDMLQGIKPIKAMAREDHIQVLLESETEDIKKAQQRHVLASEFLKAFQEPCLVIMIAVGIYYVLTYGHQSFAIILVMIFLFNKLLNRVYLAQSCFQELSMNESALWSLLASIEHTQRERETDPGTQKPVKINKGIYLDSLKFSYGKKVVLNNASLVIPAGQIVVIVGHSGTGKTTVADLIAGLFRPQTGTIYIDDTPLDQLNLRSWRHLLGYVPQEMFLFHDTIYKNISLGDHTLSRPDAEAALRLAGAWNFVSGLQSGLDTVIGERGSKLSGGQRQRLALARALVRKPKLLILDEATTALDPETERAICQTLEQLKGDMTILAISHQPAIMEIADKIYDLSSGVIKELDLRRARVSDG